MNLMDILQRPKVPEPWAEGEKIPWNDPGFSQRMLQEHLSQAHDAASRRLETVERHVAWIHETVLAAQPGRVLDLGCGPGLYAHRLARLGHTVTGIDFSPASVAYAARTAQDEGLDCRFIEQDIRAAEYGAGYDLAMLIYGEFNVFRPTDAAAILRKAHAALAPGGRLLLEVHTVDAVRRIAGGAASWYSSPDGLFCERPHLCLMETFWDEAQQAAIERFFIVDAANGAVTRYAATTQAYSDERYREMLSESGFEQIEFVPSLRGEVDAGQRDFFVISAGKAGV